VGRRPNARRAVVRRQEDAVLESARVRGGRPARPDREHREGRRRSRGGRRRARLALRRTGGSGDGPGNRMAAGRDEADARSAAQGRRQVGEPREGSVRRKKSGRAVTVRFFVHSHRPKAHLHADLRHAVGSAPGRAASGERHGRAAQRDRRHWDGRGAASPGGDGASRRRVQRRLSGRSRRVRNDGRARRLPPAETLLRDGRRARGRLDGLRHLARVERDPEGDHRLPPEHDAAHRRRGSEPLQTSLVGRRAARFEAPCA